MKFKCLEIQMLPWVFWGTEKGASGNFLIRLEDKQGSPRQ